MLQKCEKQTQAQKPTFKPVRRKDIYRHRELVPAKCLRCPSLYVHQNDAKLCWFQFIHKAASLQPSKGLR